jgi:hypothetical protein
MGLLELSLEDSFSEMVDCDLAMDLPEGTTGRNPEDYLLKLREAQSILVQTTQDCLRKHQRKRSVDGGPKNLEVTKFAAGLCAANVS